MRHITIIPDRRSSAINRIENYLFAFLLIITFSSIGFSQTPTTPEGYLEVGIKLVQAGHLDNAVAFFSKAIELKPDLADAYNNRGFVYHKQNKGQLALADFTKAIQLQPKNALYYKNRAFAYRTVNFDLAIADYTTALKLDPKDAATWDRLGEYQAQRRTSSDVLKAVDHFTEAIRLKPDFVEAYVGRGEAYINSNLKRELALADFDKAIELMPGYADAYVKRAELQRKRYNFDLAIADMTKAIQLMPRNATYYDKRGYIYLRQQGISNISDIPTARSIARSVIELAIADFTEAVKLQPNGLMPYINRATAYCALGEKALSVADYNKAKELGSKYLTICP